MFGQVVGSEASRLETLLQEARTRLLQERKAAADQVAQLTDGRDQLDRQGQLEVAEIRSVQYCHGQLEVAEIRPVCSIVMVSRGSRNKVSAVLSWSARGSRNEVSMQYSQGQLELSEIRSVQYCHGQLEVAEINKVSMQCSQGQLGVSEIRSVCSIVRVSSR